MAPNLARLIGADRGELRLRQATVTVAPAGGVATIRFGALADTTPADNIAGVRYLSTAAFVYGDTVWVLQSAGTLLILGKLA